MKDRDKINWQKVRDLIAQYDTCVRACNELQCLVNSEATTALEAIRQEIIAEMGGEDTKGD